jgi:hypothetical protein
MADDKQPQQARQNKSDRASTGACESETGRQDQSALTSEKPAAESDNPKANVKLGQHKYAEEGQPVRYIRKKE